MMNNKRFPLLIFMLLSFNASVKAISFSKVADTAVKVGETIVKVGEVVKTVAGIADAGLTISAIGVTLWGSESDQKKFARVAGYISLGTSLGQGDFESALETATKIRGERTAAALAKQGYVIEGEQEDVAEGYSEEPVVGVANAVGDIRILSDAAFASLEAHKQVVRIEDLKIGQTSSLKNQVLFEMVVPPLSQERLIQLPNGEKLVIETRELERGLRGIAPYNVDPSRYLQIAIHHVQMAGKNRILKEVGSMVEPKSEILKIKDLWCNITNNSFGILHKIGDKIILSEFIKFIQRPAAQQSVMRK